MEAAVVFLPLLGAAIAGFFGRAIGDKGAQVVTCSFLVLSALISWYLFFDVAIGSDPRRFSSLTGFRPEICRSTGHSKSIR